MKPPRSLHFLINPASGHERPVLAPLNRCLAERDVSWDATVLAPNGYRAALERALAARPDLLVVWGGDGTVAKLTTLLVELGVDVPLAPLHGGTANALASQLDVPIDLEEALGLLTEGSYSIVPTDVGFARGHAFLLRVSIGFAAAVTEHATRSQKERLGTFAYALSTLQALREVKPLQFTLSVDGVTSTHTAIACVVANSDGTGIRSPLASDLKHNDAQLDALFVPDMRWAARALANMTSGAGLMDGAPRFSGASLRVECEEPVTVHADGEDIGLTPVDISLKARALSLVKCGPVSSEDQ